MVYFSRPHGYQNVCDLVYKHLIEYLISLSLKDVTIIFVFNESGSVKKQAIVDFDFKQLRNLPRCAERFKIALDLNSSD